MGEHGDFGGAMSSTPSCSPLALTRSPNKALDIGCGEGRFCRMLNCHGVHVTGIDVTPTLIAAARVRDCDGTYLEAAAEHLPFPDATFDLVVSYLSLIGIAAIGAAIPEMARVVWPGGALLIANLNSFNTAFAHIGWAKGRDGQRICFPIDNYLQERAMWIEYRGLRILNHHRPMSTYMRALLNTGLRLVHFDEPRPTPDAPASKAPTIAVCPGSS